MAFDNLSEPKTVNWIQDLDLRVDCILSRASALMILECAFVDLLSTRLPNMVQ